VSQQALAHQPAKPNISPVTGGLLQRQCACGQHTSKGGECEECKKKREGTLQRAAINPSPVHDVPPIVHDVLRSPGQPLDAETRSFMEPRFGHDFSNVRVHTDGKASESARAVNALAYTVGRNVVFGTNRYALGTSEGRRLLAHEMTHVLQQQGSSDLQAQLSVGPANDQFEREADSVATRVLQGEHAGTHRELSATTPTLQRDLATPPPAVPAAAQPDLTPTQIQAAIAFNRARYNTANTRLIQNLLGGPVTGIWTEENIEAIAATQEEYGLQKDGKVGDATFRFLNREQRLEGMSTSTANCLTSFRVIGPDTATFTRETPTRCRFGGHFQTESQFSSRCTCSDFQYRQFIRGQFIRTRGGVVTDLGNIFTIPGGGLPAAFAEDGDTTAATVNYGHREQPSEGAANHYSDNTGADDMANGCHYTSEDFPGGPFDDCLPGDSYDVNVNFRGEIQRNGTPIQNKFWTAIRRNNWTP
jgi:hypothetical protein